MCYLLCVSSLVHVSVRVSVHVFISLSCVFFSLSTVSTLSIVSTVCAVHCVHLFRYSLHCFVFSFSLSCVSVGCVSCHDPVLVCVLCVVIPWRVSVVCCMLLLCVQDVVFVIVRAYVQRVKSGAFSHCKKYT